MDNFLEPTVFSVYANKANCEMLLNKFKPQKTLSENVKLALLRTNHYSGMLEFAVFDENKFNDLADCLNERKIFYKTRVFKPESYVVRKVLETLKQTEHEGWKAIPDLSCESEIALMQYDKEMGRIKINQSDSGDYITFSPDSKCPPRVESNICIAIIEDTSFPLVLSDSQTDLVDNLYATSLKLDNGYSVDLKNVNKISLAIDKKRSIKNEIINISLNNALFPGLKQQKCCYEVQRIIDSKNKKTISLSFETLTQFFKDMIPFASQVTVQNKDNTNVDITALVKELEGYWQKKFCLRYVIPDGRIFIGWINFSSEGKEDLPSLEDIKGKFWCEKIEAGWLGKYDLENRSAARAGTFDIDGIYKFDPQGIAPNSIYTVKEAERIIKSLELIKNESLTIPRFEGNIESCICDEETIYVDLSSKNKSPKSIKKSYERMEKAQ